MVTHLLGRDDLVKAANGTTSFHGVKYNTAVSYIDGLLTPGSEGTELTSLSLLSIGIM